LRFTALTSRLIESVQEQQLFDQSGGGSEKRWKSSDWSESCGIGVKKSKVD
jgi:hypothetical protein